MSSGFVTEVEIAEARQKRQEEWEKVRQPDQPLERPEEPYDSRSLYERLKDQRDKKDLEYDEAHKLKNLIRGLDDDEINFLDIVDKAKMDAEKQQQLQEDNELSEFRQRVASLQEQSIDKKISTESAGARAKSTKLPLKRSQKSILAGVVRKRTSDDVTENGVKNSDNGATKVQKLSEQAHHSSKVDLRVHDKGALKCIGILPGIGKYGDTSTDSEDDDYSTFDWIGRKLKKDTSDCED